MTSAAPFALVISASERTLRKVRALGLRIVHIEDPSMAVPSSAEFCDRSVVSDLADVPAVLAMAQQLDREYGFAAVLTNHEPAVVPAQVISDALGLRSSGVGSLLRDKAALRAALDGTPLGVPWEVVRHRDDVAAFIGEHGFPVILKPTTGSASVGVVVVRGPSGVAAAWAEAMTLVEHGHRFSEVLPVDTYMVERFFEGAEYSVETLSIDGAHGVLAVVEKTTSPGRVELGHTVPPARLELARRRAIEQTVVEFLTLIGFRDGAAHTEVIDGLGSVVIIESHARTGGDGIPALVAAVIGRDVELEMLAVLSGSIPGPATAASADAISKRFLTARTGRVTRLTGVVEARTMPGVIAVELDIEVGDDVHDPDASWWRVGEVVAVGATPEIAVERACRAAGHIEIEVI